MKNRLFYLFLYPFLAFGDEANLPEDAGPKAPWFTGPLLTPSANVVPKGHVNIEPYLFAYATKGVYNNSWNTVDFPTLWNVNPQVVIQVGITPWMDFQITPSWFWNYRDGASSWEIGDTIAQFDFQLYQDTWPPKGWMPSIRFSISEKFPTGRYQKLNPRKFGTDMGGNGSWTTGFILILSKLIPVYATHYLNSRLAIYLNVPAPVHVKRFNAYGGGYETDGKAYPGLNTQIDIGLEYNLNRNWALALDLVGEWNGGGSFKGNPGINLNGTPAQSSLPASIQYSLAPAIEYNWSQNLGIIAGSWFTVAGKNIGNFSSAVIAVNYYN